MFIVRENKIQTLSQTQDKEFLFDLVYEIIKENPALKLNGCFEKLIEPTQALMNAYLEKGINQFNTLKYMVKSHIYLGMDYDNDPQFDWIEILMENYNIEDQVTYVDAFYTILEDYKKKVIGKNFEYLLDAINHFKQHKFKAGLGLIDIYPRKLNYLIEKNINIDVENNSFEIFLYGENFQNNFFIKNICEREM